MPHLRIKTGPQVGKIFDIASDSIKLGREGSCSVILNENGVSREHAEIYKVGDMYFIRDLGSRNGLTVNENEAKDELLRDGDIIRICSFSLVFESTPYAEEIDDESSFLDEDEDENEMDTMTITVNPSDSMKKVAPKTGEAIKKLSAVLMKLEKVDDLYEEFLNVLFDVMNIQEAFIFVLGAGNKLGQRAYRNKDDSRPGKASRSIVLRALKEKETICTANAQDDFRFKSQDSIVLKNISSVLCSPLIAFGQELGVIYLNNDLHSKPFHQESAEIVSTMANQLSLAILSAESRKRELITHNRSIKLIAQTVEGMHAFLKGRAERVEKYCSTLAKYLKLKSSHIEHLKTAAHLHHLGYLNISTNKTFNLDELQKDVEYVKETMQTLKENNNFADVNLIIQYHRYRLDGQGYPSKLSQSQWGVESQILACAVELDLRINLPMFITSADSEEYKSQNEIVSEFIQEGTQIVSKPVIRAVESSSKAGHLLAT
jgi:pSer/pThr/pTyr-binding forkhead associated (FHA) protein/response regulator RpfG family c-di-GMP phosphodiesterase